MSRKLYTPFEKMGTELLHKYIMSYIRNEREMNFIRFYIPYSREIKSCINSTFLMHL